ncbi:MAG: carboxypeptidase regulatory-like domain-containing protein [Vicinamibacterales bacterium]
MKRNAVRLLAGVLIAGMAACSGDQKNAAPAGPPAGALRVDEASAGHVSGRVMFEGTPPANAPVKISADATCMQANANGLNFENVVVTNGGLDNVFVYVKDGLGNYYFDTPTEPVKIDQQGCRYVPHVVGARVGQPLEFSNSDDTLHNVHAVANVNRQFNFGQAIKGQKDTRVFTAREVMVPLKCDVHGWMQAYAGILDHPYFAVTTGGGTFQLKNLPAGTYTVEAWHEKLPAQTQTVTIRAKETQDIRFTFRM